MNVDPLIASLFIPISISATYFFASIEKNPYKRVLSSAHGVCLVLALGYAAAASRWSSFQDWEFYIWPFYLLLMAYVSSVGYSLVRYRGTKLVHVLQPFLLPFAFWMIGTFAITHDSI